MKAKRNLAGHCSIVLLLLCALQLRTMAANSTPLITNFVAFSPSGQLIGTSSPNRPVRIWDAATGTTIGSPSLHEWTIRLGGARYGVTEFGPFATFPRRTFFVWHSKAYRLPAMPAWVVLLGMSLVGTCLVRAAYRQLCRNRP